MYVLNILNLVGFIYYLAKEVLVFCCFSDSEADVTGSKIKKMCNV